MRVVSSQQTDTGRVRERNEDYLWVDEQAGVYIVADGVGGCPAGDVASRLGATTVGERIVARFGDRAEPLSSEAVRARMVGAFETANERVRRAGAETPDHLGMATVLIAALVRPPRAYICHAGDARAYLASGASLSRLTEDDSTLALMVALGLVSPAEARGDPRLHGVTKVVGQDWPVRATFTEVSLGAGDWLLLCTDGLWDLVDDEEMLIQLQQAEDDPSGAAGELVAAANAAGGTDNISVVAIRMLSHEQAEGASPCSMASTT